MTDQPTRPSRPLLFRPMPMMLISSVLGLGLGGLLGSLVGYPWIAAGLGLVHSSAIVLLLIVMIPPRSP